MSDVDGLIYIGTILLEINRWTPGKQPTYRVSEWTERFAAAGFDGMELWENHAVLCPSDELAALAADGFPVAVFNTYCGFDDEQAAERDRAVELSGRLCAAGLKFNVGGDPTRREVYLRNLAAWRDRLPANCRVLCECHPGTIVEQPAVAAEFFDQLGRERYEAMVHPFTWGLDSLRRWFEHLGPMITHAHVQLRAEEGGLLRLDRNPELVREALAIMRGEGFRGSFTLEFTEGTRTEGENIEDLYAAALADLEFLRDNLS